MCVCVCEISGVVVIDQILSVLLTSSMFVGGFLGFLLDNIFPGLCVLHIKHECHHLYKQQITLYDKLNQCLSG